MAIDDWNSLGWWWQEVGNRKFCWRAPVRPRGQETYPSGLNRNNRAMNTLAIVNPRCLLIRVPFIATNREKSICFSVFRTTETKVNRDERIIFDNFHIGIRIPC